MLRRVVGASPAACSSAKSPVLYFFPVPEPVSCGGAVSKDDPRLPASRMETGPPRAPRPHRRPPHSPPWPPPTTSNTPTLTPCPFEAHFFLLLTSAVIQIPPLFVHRSPPPMCPSPPCFHLSAPPFPLASLLPLSRSPGQHRVCQAFFPVQAAGPDHTSRGDFCNDEPGKTRKLMPALQLLYAL